MGMFFEGRVSWEGVQGEAPSPTLCQSTGYTRPQHLSSAPSSYGEPDGSQEPLLWELLFSYRAEVGLGLSCDKQPSPQLMASPQWQSSQPSCIGLKQAQHGQCPPDPPLL